MSDHDSPAFPLPNTDGTELTAIEASGLTKLQWAAVQLAAGMLLDGACHATEEARKQIATDAVALACEVLRQAAP